MPAPYTGWTFSHIFDVKKVMLEKTEINEKEAGNGAFKKIFFCQINIEKMRL